MKVMPEVLDLSRDPAFNEAAIVSREILRHQGGKAVAFSFDQGQGLSTHTSPYDAFVLVLEGEGVFTVGGTPATLLAGQALVMPASVPHAVQATQRMRMLLCLFKPQDGSGSSQDASARTTRSM